MPWKSCSFSSKKSPKDGTLSSCKLGAGALIGMDMHSSILCFTDLRNDELGVRRCAPSERAVFVLASGHRRQTSNAG